MQNPADPPFPPAGPAFDEARVLDALWQVVATRGWHDVTFARIAAESGVGLDSLRSRYGTPMALLAAHARAVDATCRSKAGRLDLYSSLLHSRRYALYRVFMYPSPRAPRFWTLYATPLSPFEYQAPLTVAG